MTHAITPKKALSLAVLVIIMVICGIRPLDYFAYGLHQVGTFIMLMALYVLNKRLTLSESAFMSYVAFLGIHVVASHYLYSYVPYDEWLSVVGININETFGFKRNMFDRLVHFCYGLLLYGVMFDGLGRYFGVDRAKTHLIAMGFVMASSMVYELIEWAIAMLMSPQTAEQYNGQQGDIWDAHADMALASLGSLVAVALMSIKPKP